jgi:hypothetical protein
VEKCSGEDKARKMGLLAVHCALAVALFSGIYFMEFEFE